MTAVDEVKSRLDIVDIVSEYMPLRKAGSSYSGFCPFHPNTRSPAFAVFPSTQTWYCFGACSEGGDMFSFIMKKQGWDFQETLAHLAAKAGVDLSVYRTKSQEAQAYEDKLTDLLEAAADYFHQILLYAPQAEAARQYVDSRGIAEETAELFKIGFALESWEACRDHFNMQGYNDEELTAAGLLTLNEEKGTRYDRFRNRLMIPIRDANGIMVGFGARTLDPEGLPKYLNSPQTAVFDKSRLLFGLDLAKKYIREARRAVIVEGYMDVIQAWQSGFQNVVAQMGTALTAPQIQILKRYTKRFILALDSDAAGKQATMRGLEVARESLDRESDVRFDARGLVQHEGRLQADIHVISLPQGYDPDAVIRENPEQWSDLINKAKPVVTYVIDLVTEDLDMDDGKAKTEAAQRVLPLINDVADAVEREHYRQLLARKLRVDERSLRMITTRASRTARTSTIPEPPPGIDGPESRMNAAGAGVSAVISGQTIDTELRRSDFLRKCLLYPTIVAQLDDLLMANDQPKVGPEDFSKPDDRAIWRFVRGKVDTWTIASPGNLWDSLEDEFLRDRVNSLLSSADGPAFVVERLPETLAKSVLDWRLEHIRGLIDEVRMLFDDPEVAGDVDRKEMLTGRLRELTSKQKSINKARASLSASGRRRAFDESSSD